MSWFWPLLSLRIEGWIERRRLGTGNWESGNCELDKPCGGRKRRRSGARFDGPDFEQARAEVTASSGPGDTLPEAQNCLQKRDQVGKGTRTREASKSPRKPLKKASCGPAFRGQTQS